MEEEVGAEGSEDLEFCGRRRPGRWLSPEQHPTTDESA
jgi:hypothetical protein